LTLLCQALNIDDEKFLWVDGINPEDPVVVSISSVREMQWAGSFKEFVSARPDLADQILSLESAAAHSPTLLARSILYMSRDASLTAADALEMAEEQALDIIEADSESASQMGV
ncbi:unnamed protein product, partial [Phaeothamnion confervicola]